MQKSDLINNNIHIIWLGDNPIYDKFLKNNEKFFKNFNIKIWDENNNLNITNKYYLNNLYNKNYAYASDYLRFKILYEFGGLYFDTDVEFLQNIDDLLEKGNFLGTEHITKRVSSGVIMYFNNPYNIILKKVLDFYDKYENNNYICDGLVLSHVLSKYGYVLKDYKQELKNIDITVYDSTYFCPGIKENPYLNKTFNTRAVHHYTNFWKK